jgi:hypothetical protein
LKWQYSLQHPQCGPPEVYQQFEEDKSIAREKAGGKQDKNGPRDMAGDVPRLANAGEGGKFVPVIGWADSVSWQGPLRASAHALINERSPVFPFDKMSPVPICHQAIQNSNLN